MVEGIDDKYKVKLNLLSSCCEKLQKENETIAHKILQSKRNLRKARKLRMRLLQKLDDVGIEWRLELEQIKDNPSETVFFPSVSDDDFKPTPPTPTQTNASLAKNNNSQGKGKGKSAANSNSSKTESKSNKTGSDKTKMKNLYHDSNKNMNGSFLYS